MGTLILASSSPRRRQMLTNMGLDFEVIPADIDETPRRGERPEALVRRLAATKALTVAARNPSAVVLGADTVVSLGQVILGKPHDAEHARAMLQMLSGNRHEICTGVAVWQGDQALGFASVNVTHVTFRPLSTLEIETYVATGEPMDKAGAYAIQGGAGAWVTSYEGNLETVIGLPRDTVARLLERIRGDQPWEFRRRP